MYAAAQKLLIQEVPGGTAVGPSDRKGQDHYCNFFQTTILERA